LDDILLSIMDLWQMKEKEKSVLHYKSWPTYKLYRGLYNTWRTDYTLISRKRQDVSPIRCGVPSFNDFSNGSTRIGGCRQNGLLIPRSPFSRHPPIEIHSVNLSLMHFIQKIQVPMNPFCVPKTLQLTIMWRHMTSMAL
jgi:hypothetical protein